MCINSNISFSLILEFLLEVSFINSQANFIFDAASHKLVRFFSMWPYHAKIHQHSGRWAAPFDDFLYPNSHSIESRIQEEFTQRIHTPS